LAAVYVKESGQSDKIYYVHTDHLGSIIKLTDANGTAVFQASYDAWGNQTITNNTFAFHRGYTGHEHLPEFNLINMNGRMYDPIVGRFLSADPFVQMPEFSQTFNRYSYCLNNPFKYTDPNGYWWGIDDLIVAGLGFVVGYVSYGISTGDWGGKAFAAGGIAAGTSWLTYNTAGAASSLLTKSLGEGAATVIGNSIGGAVGSFAGNVAGQAYFNGSIDFGIAGQAALYGFGYGIGSGVVDGISIDMQFPMHHTIKHMLRSTAGELMGNAFTVGYHNNYGDMTFGLNAGIFLPFMSDAASLTSPLWASKIAQKKYNELMRQAKENGVDVDSNVKLSATIDYGVYTEDSGNWLAGSNDGDFVYNEVGVSLRLKVLDGGFSVNKIGQTSIGGLQILNMSGFKLDFPLLKLPFSYTSAIHFTNAYANSYRLWGRR
jgi:RHS repeat-associated protein